MAGSWTRRAFVGGSGLLIAASTVGCDALSTEPTEEQGSSGDTDRDAKEAPMLSARVRDGSLPRLPDRLPETPLVIEPNDEPGQYGGTWRTAIQGVADTSWLARTVGFENLVAYRLSTDWAGRQEDVIPNLAESWEANAEATEFVFNLRPGVKWSDGEPFTADDVVFAQNEVLGNAELFPVPRFPGSAEKVDDHTVRFKLTEPNGVFLQRQAESAGADLTGMPLHYLKEFHPDHNPDLDALVAEEGADSWIELFGQKADDWANPDLPRLNAWVVTTPLGESSQVIVERNPYYWKTDPDGRQLPYLDRVTYDVIADLEALTLKATNGELDCHTRHVNTLQNKPILARERDRANYDFIDLMSSAPSNTMLIEFNLSHRDEVTREIFRNKDFRIGLSHAINRQEIIDATLQSQGEPAQHGPRPESPFYNEQLMTQYVEYDEALANEHLDRAGYTEKNEEGLRLGPDGKPITFTVEVTEIFGMPWIDMLELVRDYWLAVGVKIRVQSMDRSLHNENTAANSFDAQVWEGQGGLDTLVRPGDFVPINPSQARYAPAWAQWYNTGGTTGEEPPEATLEQLRLYDEFLATVDQAEQGELLGRILEIAADEFYSIGISMLPESYGIVRNDFHNVPAVIVESFLYNTPGAANPCQFFTSAE